jgi:hypothetical protein
MLRNARTSFISRAGLRIPVFVFAVLVTAFVVIGPVSVHAQIQTASLQQTTEAAGMGGGSDLITIIGRLINIFLGTLGVIFLILMLFAGYLWMTAGGDIEKVKKAQMYIRNAIIGLVIIASAWAIVAFVLGFFSGNGGWGGGTSKPSRGIGFSPGAGSLGGGIIESHYPPRNATNIARNTKIIITFKKPIKLSTMIAGYNDNGTPANLADDTVTEGLKDDSILIYPTADGGTKAYKSNEMRVRFTADRKTFVFSKVSCTAAAGWDCFGSAKANMGYTVELLGGKTGILVEGSTTTTVDSGLANCPNGGWYCWNFETGKDLDLTPPHIVAVIPPTSATTGGAWARNIVVQVVFSEAMDPTAAAGFVLNGQGFQNIRTHAGGMDTLPVDGEYRMSNQYRTVEFIPTDLCGRNSCGRDIFCLPGPAAIDVLVKAAHLDGDGPTAQFTTAGYDGIVDVCGNSLDGDNNGHADGPDKDNYLFSFGTSQDINLASPIIETTQPPSDPEDPGKSNIDPYAPVGVRFDSLLQSSSFNTDNAYIKTKESADFNDTFWWQTGVFMLTDKNEPVKNPVDIPVKSLGTVEHRVYASSTEYDPFMLSGIQNAYQNCFNPASSYDKNTKTGCPATQENPNCCDNTPGKVDCVFTPTP